MMLANARGRVLGSSMVALAAAIYAPFAFAQTVVPSLSEAEKAGEATEQQAGDIVVTAQKRSERLVDVPASVTALSAQSLLAQGALRFEDYQAFVPGLSTTTVAPGYNQINIRGITTGANQLSSTVSTYFDEAPTNSSTAAAIGNRLTPDPDLLDISRIEVLRGPQGTLYGANALGGVLKYVFVEPELNEVRGQAQAGLSAVAHGGTGYVARAAVGAPLVDGQLGVRVSGFYTRDAGFIDNVATGENNVNRSINRGGRVALRWKASDSLSATAAALYQKRDTGGFPSETVGSSSLVPQFGKYRQSSPTDEFVRSEYQLYTLSVDADLGFADLVSATSYGRQASELAFDYSPSYGVVLALSGVQGVPYVTLPSDNDVRKFTQELRLASPTGRTFEYVVGGYYTRETSGNVTGATAFLVSGAPAPGPINPLLAVTLDNRYRETALFANMTLNANARFSLQAGGRWSRNTQRSSELLGGLLFGPLGGTVIGSRSAETAWTFAVSPQYKFTPDWNVYARVAKGFRPGGANLVIPGGGGASDYGSDTLINYEAGTKAALVDHRLNLSLATFWIDWRDIQTTAKDALGFNFLVNGGRARSRGVEGEARWSADGLNVGANLSYTDAKLRDPITAVGARSGDRLPYTPHWAGAFSVDYDLLAGGHLTPTIGAGLRYTGRRQAYYSLPTATNPGDLQLGGFVFLDLRAGVRVGGYQISAFAENVTDKRAILSAQTEGASPLDGSGARATIARPRTIGVMLGTSF